MSKVRKKIIVLMMFFILMSLSSCTDKKIDSSNFTTRVDKEVEDVIISFVNNLFEKNKDVLNYSTGSVKSNIYNNFDSINKSKVISIDSMQEVNEKEFAVVHSAIQYEYENNANVVFYRFKLIKKEDKYLVYQIEESGPIFIGGDIGNQLSEDMLSPIEDYLNIVARNNLEKGIEYLVGNARKNHLLTYKYLENISELNNVEISDVRYEMKFNNENISLVEVKYRLGNRDATILVTLFNTYQGWLIYDITQI